MQNIESPNPVPETFTVVTWNILLDKTRSKQENKDNWFYVKPQHERLPSQVETLRSLGISLDVVAIQEAQETKERHNGIELARQLGFEASFWYEHNRSKRKGEHIGMFGNLVDSAEAFELPHDKKLVVAQLGDVAIANYHARNEYLGPMRSEQAREIVGALEGFDKAVVVGDANDIPLEKSRHVLYDAGFRPAQYSGGKKHPRTYPTPEYRKIMMRSADDGSHIWKNQLLRNRMPLDIIYLRGLAAIDGGVFKGDSDHYGRWARIAL